MKTLQIITFALFATATLTAQDLIKTEVPTSFTEGLLKEYPNAKNIEWERSDNNFKVEFDVDRMERKVFFNKDGDKVKIEAEMIKTKLPIVLIESIKKHYADYRIDSVRSFTKNGITTYKVDLERAGWTEEITLTYSEAGKVLGINKD
ncbi:hypothetical protein ES676_01455 [Bizionia saleffrena]|uniref:Putative beta-lactamase-inhibitor-like PepSY-like domain-containing protein n=1 Tax=Bizionia saleffrena TaxID=291189 RepID=A0A8H2QKQ9_9FLAO|nr:PepSY-like domain-containing protein [Bizionia saleffrena]TYB80360.1 hypothetical protein ES676_01455 [Bizionia saleffrena]